MSEDNTFDEKFEKELYKNYPELKGYPVVIDYRYLPADDKEIREKIKLFAMEAIYSDNHLYKYENYDNVTIKKRYAKDVLTIIKKNNGQWKIYRLFDK